MKSDRWSIVLGKSPSALADMEEGSFHACVTDPPYELSRGTKGRGFMGKTWDGSGVAFRVDTWQAVWRLLKPGAHVIASGGSRTSHRITVAIEDAGFEIRDKIIWLYSVGFPKNLDVSKAIDESAGVERPVVGFDAAKAAQQTPKIDTTSFGDYAGSSGIVTAPATPGAVEWAGWGTALKPAYEDIIVARKPLDGTVVNNVLTHGTGAMNIDACRIEGVEGRARGVEPSAGRRYKEAGVTAFSLLPGTRGGDPLGRWPANVAHDDSEEIRLYMGDGRRFFFSAKASVEDREEGTHGLPVGRLRRVNRGGMEHDPRWADRERRNTHVTVKPSKLMEWLVRMVTPAGGLVLDPFAGSGTTGIAALRQGFRFTGVEMEEASAKIARARVKWAALHPIERAMRKADQNTLFDGMGDDGDGA